MAMEEMIVILACDFFFDTLYDQQLQIYFMQVHPGDLQVVLARVLKFEAFLKTTSDQVLLPHIAMTSGLGRQR